MLPARPERLERMGRFLDPLESAQMDKCMDNTLEERKALDMPIASTVSMRKLGQTEISVTPVGLGMMELGGSIKVP